MGLTTLLADLSAFDIDICEPKGDELPPHAVLHDRAAILPKIIVSPRTEEEVIQVLQTLYRSKTYDEYPVSIRSGGHGYFNGATCSGIMMNMGSMTKRDIVDDVLHVEPGAILGQLVWTLAQHGKAIPHGDCFGVGAGGHFITAGWDIALARRYGLGCQSLIGGRIVLWDGSVLDVNEETHPDLLHAMRGGAAAGVGVITSLRLQLIPEPPFVTRCFRILCEKEKIDTCVKHNAFANSHNLPDEISLAFRFFFEPDQLDPKCSFNIVSLLPVSETLTHLQTHLGPEVTSLVASHTHWVTDSLLSLRTIPASSAVTSKPSLLASVSPEALHEDPLAWWTPTVSAREMARSFFTSISHWVAPSSCDDILLSLCALFHSARTHTHRERMYALVIQGGGQITAKQNRCSMPLGQALARFELHWDEQRDEEWCRAFTRKVEDVLEENRDEGVERPYRGDIWKEEQAWDGGLEGVKRKWDRRNVKVAGGEEDVVVGVVDAP